MNAKIYSRAKSITVKAVILIMALSLQSCLAILLIRHQAKPSLEQDDIKGITRYKSTLHYLIAEEKNSAFFRNEQQIFKEISSGRNIYKVYDYLKLDQSINQVESTIYYVIDGVAYPIPVQLNSSKTLSEIDKDKQDVLLSDSTTTSIITDYDITNYTFLSLEYEINEELIVDIAKGKEVKIRYYAPPEMMTLNLSKNKKNTFLKLANSGIDSTTNF